LITFLCKALHKDTIDAATPDTPFFQVAEQMPHQSEQSPAVTNNEEGAEGSYEEVSAPQAKLYDTGLVPGSKDHPPPRTMIAPSQSLVEAQTGVDTINKAQARRMVTGALERDGLRGSDEVPEEFIDMQQAIINANSNANNPMNINLNSSQNLYNSPCTWKGNNNRACQSPQISGSNYCTNHLCPHPGCAEGKSSKSNGCVAHAGPIGESPRNCAKTWWNKSSVIPPVQQSTKGNLPTGFRRKPSVYKGFDVGDCEGVDA
jgi:hypothetical protein